MMSRVCFIALLAVAGAVPVANEKNALVAKNAKSVHELWGWSPPSIGDIGSAIGDIGSTVGGYVGDSWDDMRSAISNGLRACVPSVSFSINLECPFSDETATAKAAKNQILAAAADTTTSQKVAINKEERAALMAAALAHLESMDGQYDGKPFVVHTERLFDYDSERDGKHIPAGLTFKNVSHELDAEGNIKAIHPLDDDGNVRALQGSRPSGGGGSRPSTPAPAPSNPSGGGSRPSTPAPSNPSGGGSRPSTPAPSPPSWISRYCGITTALEITATPTMGGCVNPPYATLDFVFDFGVRVTAQCQRSFTVAHTLRKLIHSDGAFTVKGQFGFEAEMNGGLTGWVKPSFGGEIRADSRSGGDASMSNPRVQTGLSASANMRVELNGGIVFTAGPNFPVLGQVSVATIGAFVDARSNTFGISTGGSTRPSMSIDAYVEGSGGFALSIGGSFALCGVGAGFSSGFDSSFGSRWDVYSASIGSLSQQLAMNNLNGTVLAQKAPTLVMEVDVDQGIPNERQVRQRRALWTPH